MAGCAEGMRKFYQDVKPLIPLKSAVFFFYGGVFSLLPYLSLHMQSLGLSLQQTAIVYAVLLLASSAGSPIAGYLTDKTGRFKLVLSIAIITTAVLHSCLLLVPNIKKVVHPRHVQLACTTRGSYLFIEPCRSLEPDYCYFTDRAFGSHLSVESCHSTCPHDVIVKNRVRLPPGPRICFLHPNECQSFNQSIISDLTFDFIPSIYLAKDNCVHRIKKFQLGGEEVYEMNCPASKLMCSVWCNATILSRDNNTLTCMEELGDPVATFYIYFALRLLCMISLAASYPLVEAAILIQTKDLDAQFGKQRVWSNIAMTIFPPVSGVLIDVFSKQSPGPRSYLPAFILFDVLLIMTLLVVVYSLSIGMKPQPKLKCQHLKKLFYCWDAILLYVAVLFLGALWGFLETFLFVYLSDIGSSKLLLGLSRMVGGLACIPAMFFADAIMNRLGRANVLIAAFICFGLQIMCYSFIRNPWLAIPVELFKFFTSGLKVAAIVTLANVLAPKGLVATMQATVRSLNYEIGSGVGNLVGGTITATLGFHETFRGLAIASGVIGVLYGISHYTLGSKNSPCSDATKVPTTEEGAAEARI